MKIELHAWQTKVARETRAALRQYVRVVMCCPTGSGKTVMALVGVIKRPYRKVLWVTHRKFLREQVAGYAKKNVEVCSVFQDIPLGDYDLVIVDEAHHAPASSYQQVFKWHANTPILGLTATPYRTDGQGLGSCGFRRIVISPSIYELSKQGYLAPIEDFYSNLDTRKPWSVPKTAELILAHRDRWGFGKGLVYGRSLEENQRLVKRLSKFFNVRSIDYTQPDDEVMETLRAFKDGDLDLLVNHTVLTEGYDLPELDYVAINRYTESRSLWKQIYGRAMRPFGDKLARVVDLAGNHLKHGRIFDEEELTLDGRFIVSRPRENPQEETERTANREVSKVEDVGSSVCRYAELPKKYRRTSRHVPKSEIVKIWERAPEFPSLTSFARAEGRSVATMRSWMVRHKLVHPSHWQSATNSEAVAEDLRSGEAARFPNQKAYSAAKDVSRKTVSNVLMRHPHLKPSQWGKTIPELLQSVQKTETLSEFLARSGRLRASVVRVLRKQPHLRPSHWDEIRWEAAAKSRLSEAVKYASAKDFAEAIGVTATAVHSYFRNNPDERPKHWRVGRDRRPTTA